MRSTTTVVALLALALFTGCVKAGKEVAEEIGIIPSTCGTDGARLEAEVDGASFCADGQVVAVGDGSTANVTGLALLGSTITLQLDTLALGSFNIDEANNAILYMSLGTPYVSMGEAAGTLTITHCDGAARHVKGEFTATVRNEMSGAQKNLSGSFDVVYSDGE